MRKVEYLSPTSVKKWCEDRDAFYKDYLYDMRLQRDPQTQPMSIGSSFDAYVKSALFNAIYGPISPQFEFTTLFEAQVEPHNRDWALEHGLYAFEEYKRLGAFDDLLIQLNHAGAEPKFETELRGPVGKAILLGKPDAYYRNKEGHPVIFDWKVNGYCGKGNTSPKKGYAKLRGDSKKTIYPGARLEHYKGTLINTSMKFEQCDQEWAAQLSVYAWLLGNMPGDDFIVAIDQLACAGNGTAFADIRVAEHRALVGAEFQKDFFRLTNKIWDQIQTGHIYDHLTLEQSQERCRQMDAICIGIHSHATGVKNPQNVGVAKGRMTF